MRWMGYCTGCHKVRLVRVAAESLAAWTARGRTGVLMGTCAECEEGDHRG